MLGTKPFTDTTVTATATLLRTGAVDLNTVHILNANAAITYLQLFDAAKTTDVTLGTTLPTVVLKAEASIAPFFHFPRSVSFPLGLVYALTTTATGAIANGATSVISLTVG